MGEKVCSKCKKKIQRHYITDMITDMITGEIMCEDCQPKVEVNK